MRKFVPLFLLLLLCFPAVSAATPAEQMQMADIMIEVQENTTIIMATPPTSIQMASARMIMMTRPAAIPVHPLADIYGIYPLCCCRFFIQ